MLKSLVAVVLLVKQHYLLGTVVEEVAFEGQLSVGLVSVNIIHKHLIPDS